MDAGSCRGNRGEANPPGADPTTGALATGALGALIVLGSRNLTHFDAALVGYNFACLFATFGIAYRYSMWLQRPPTALYGRRGWQLFFRPRFLGRNVVQLGRRLIGAFALNHFIRRRGGAMIGW